MTKIAPCAMAALGNPGTMLLAALTTELMNGVDVSSPRMNPIRLSLPDACVGSPPTVTTELLVESGNCSPSRLPAGVPEGAELSISRRSLPLVGSYEKDVLNGIVMSKGHGAVPVQPGDDAEKGPLNTVVASGPTLSAYFRLGNVWPLTVFG